MAAVAAATLLGAGACKSHTANPQAQAQVSNEEKQAQALIQSCAVKANFLTKTGRQAFYKCVAPPGQEEALQACATRYLAKDGVLTKAARQRFEADLATCIVPSPSATPSHKGNKK